MSWQETEKSRQTQTAQGELHCSLFWYRSLPWLQFIVKQSAVRTAYKTEEHNCYQKTSLFCWKIPESLGTCREVESKNAYSSVATEGAMTLQSLKYSVYSVQVFHSTFARLPSGQRRPNKTIPISRMKLFFLHITYNAGNIMD